MRIPNNSLMGNIQKNTGSMLERVAEWAVATMKAHGTYVDYLAGNKSPRAKVKLKKLADKYSIAWNSSTTKAELAERIKNCFNNRHSIYFDPV